MSTRASLPQGARRQCWDRSPQFADDDDLIGNSDASEDDGTTRPFELVPNRPDALVVRDAGFFHATIVEGRVWHDVNQNGVRDNEYGVENVAVHLLDASGNSVASTKTNRSGKYYFNQLDSGRYVVAFDRPEATHFTTRRGPSANTSDVDPATGRTSTLSVQRYDRETVDVGVFSPDGTESIRGRVWHDHELYPGSYTLQFVRPSGSQISIPGGHSQPDPETGNTGLFRVASGQSTRHGAGFYAADVTSVTGSVWHDVDGNGIRERNEPGMEGVGIALVDESRNVVRPVRKIRVRLWILVPCGSTRCCPGPPIAGGI